MKTKHNLCTEMFARVSIFGDEQKDKLPLSARAIELLEANKVNLTAIRLAIRDQASGNTGSNNGVELRARYANDLKFTLSVMAGIARSLDPVEFPEALHKFPAPRRGRTAYAELIGQARAFAKDAASMKDAFIRRGMAEDFIEQLIAKATKFEEASGVKDTGIQGRAESVAAIDNLVRKGMRIIRELRACLRLPLESNPALKQAFLQASRVKSASRRSSNTSSAEPAKADSAPAAATPVAGLAKVA